MTGPESLRNQEGQQEKEPVSSLDVALDHGNVLLDHVKQKNEEVSNTLQSLPETIDRGPLLKKFEALEDTKNRIGEVMRAAALLAALQSTQAYAESALKDTESAPSSQEQVETDPSYGRVDRVKATIELFEAVVEDEVNKVKRKGKKVIDGVDTKGKPIEGPERVEKASEMIPSQVPVIGTIAAFYSTMKKIKREIDEKKPGYAASVLGQAARFLLDIPTKGVASLAWNKIKKKEEPKKDSPSTDSSQNEVQSSQPPQEELHEEGDGGEFDGEKEESTNEGLIPGTM